MSPVVPISLHWTFLTTFWNYTILKWGLVCSTEKDTIIYFFVNPRGDAFSQASYSNCISALFEKHFSNRLTAADLRKAVIAQSFSLPQSSDYSLRESFATLMKNSVPTQKRYWDKRPLAQKKSRAVNLLGSFASWSPDKDSVEIISDEDKGNIEYLPGQVEFDALVAANSTETSPEVFVATVLRLSEDQKLPILQTVKKQNLENLNWMQGNLLGGGQCVDLSSTHRLFAHEWRLRT